MSDSVHMCVAEATQLMWDGKFEAANALLSKDKATNPRFALEFAFSHLVQSLMNATNEKRESLLELFQSADALAQSQRKGTPMQYPTPVVASPPRVEPDEDEEDLTEEQRLEITATQQPVPTFSNDSWKLECDVIYADAMLVRSIMQLMMNSFLKGGINLRVTWGHYYGLMQLIEKNPSLPRDLQLSIKCGCGVFYTYLALVPAGLMTVLSAIGFISDKELGEQLLTEVYESDSIRSPVAALVLCTYYLFLPTGLGDVRVTLRKAEKILTEMNRRYPTNTCFFGYMNLFHRKRGEPEEALEAITTATKNAAQCGVAPLLLRYLHADTLYMNLQFEEARTAYTAILDTMRQTGETFSYTGQVVLSLAATYVMTGDDGSAMTWLGKVKNMYNAKSKQDANSPKFAAKVLKEPKLLPLLGFYILYINRDLAHMKASHVALLEAELARVTQGRDMSSAEVSGMFELFKGVIQKCKGNENEAYSILNNIITNERKYGKDSMVPSYAYYEIGELEYHRGNVALAKSLLEKGASLKGDGHETLANRYRIALKQINRESKEKTK